MPAATVEGEASTSGSDRQLRADIQALRALAVGSVVLYHLWPIRLSGGYVGVDVFFVISGFLITSHLLGELNMTGAVHPLRFWARRAKRLVPASSVVLLCATFGTMLWVPRRLWHQFLEEIVASSLQVQNWLLAHNSVDYLARNDVASHVQHFWTLAVEEQFYIGLPVLLLLIAGLARLLRIGHGPLVVVPLAVAVVASFVYSVVYTSANPGVAYFSTLTRAWEFGVGALLAWAATRPARHRRRVWRRQLWPWVGVGAIVYACFAFGAGTAIPGWAVAVPVGGAALAIWTGRGSTLDRLGSVPPVALVGGISYAAYLWHWPMLVILPYATGHPLTTKDKLAIIVATGVASWVSTRFIEDPIRFSPRLLGRRRPAVVLACCATAVAVVVGLSTATMHWQSIQAARLLAQTRQLLAGHPDCLGAAAMDPALAPCNNPALNGVLTPDPNGAAKDDANERPCWALASGEAKVCTLGPATGYTKKIYAFGDSHNNALIGVYQAIATHNQWRIDVSGNGGCYFTAARQSEPSTSLATGCHAWRASVLKNAQQGHYDAFIVTHSAGMDRVIPAPGQTPAQATVHGLVQAWQSLPDLPIIAIRDNPQMARSTMSCVEQHRDTAATACALPRLVGLHYPDGSAEAAQQVPRAKVIDMSSFYCTASACPPVIGHVLVYRDVSHVSATYAATLEPYIEAHVVADLR